ncbi:MAG: hypothetical protein J6C18_06770 [Bacteroidaceae bacterium]|nr:hypothetical protein [Bacteroidaceae bacterium]
MQKSGGVQAFAPLQTRLFRTPAMSSEIAKLKSEIQNLPPPENQAVTNAQSEIIVFSMK